MRLEEYLAKRGLTQEAFADCVGVSQGTISRLLPQDGRAPKRRPSWDLAAKIRTATSGEVTESDFVDGLSTAAE